MDEELEQPTHTDKLTASNAQIKNSEGDDGLESDEDEEVGRDWTKLLYVALPLRRCTLQVVIPRISVSNQGLEMLMPDGLSEIVLPPHNALGPERPGL